MELSVKILHLYPDLLNLYGDKGNIACMKKRLEWRGINVNVVQCLHEDQIDLIDVDIIFIGGGSDREQKLVCDRLIECRSELVNFVDSSGVLVAVCGGYQLLGNYYKINEDKVRGLGILDIYTESGPTRLIGNVVVHNELTDFNIVGFENHSGRTYIGEHSPLGKVIFGHGNTEDSGYEGVSHKNIFATYLHGPLLPKNPQLCDIILTSALRRKYENFDFLSPLDDELELRANNYVCQTYL